MNRLAIFLASVGYAGYAPVAPGTVGSAAALVFYAALRWLQLTRLEIGIILILFAVGVWSATRTARSLGRTDPGVVVIDEVVGMLVSIALLPVSATGAFVAFLIFRVFDIIKPWPAAYSERWPGGLGIMADDVFAGLYAQVTMRLLAWAVPSWTLQS